MTARLACSAGDPTHHLPPGSPSSKNNRIFTVPVQAVGCVDWKPPKNSSLLKYLYVGDLVYIAKRILDSAPSKALNNQICASFVLVWGFVHDRDCFSHASVVI